MGTKLRCRQGGQRAKEAANGCSGRCNDVDGRSRGHAIGGHDCGVGGEDWVLLWAGTRLVKGVTEVRARDRYVLQHDEEPELLGKQKERR